MFPCQDFQTLWILGHLEPMPYMPMSKNSNSWVQMLFSKTAYPDMHNNAYGAFKTFGSRQFKKLEIMINGMDM